MLFLVYWELNENMSEEERIQITQKLTSSELFPLQGRHHYSMGCDS